MDDYKELIEELRNFTVVGFNDDGFPIVRYPSELERNAADAIEQLAWDNNVLTKERDELYMEVMDCTKKIGCKAIEQVKKERDAAVEDLNVARSCLTCKSNGFDICEGCDSWASKRNWEWRGG